MGALRGLAALATVAVLGLTATSGMSAPVEIFIGSGDSDQTAGSACQTVGECAVPTAAKEARDKFMNGTGSVVQYQFAVGRVEEFYTPPHIGATTQVPGSVPPIRLFGTSDTAIRPDLSNSVGTLKSDPNAFGTGTVANTNIDSSGTQLGRFDTTTVGRNLSTQGIPDSGWFETAYNFTIELDQLDGTNAIGFYLTDLGDAQASVQLIFKKSGVALAGPPLSVPSSQTAINGVVQFFGVYASGEFDSVDFLVTQPAATNPTCEKTTVCDGDFIGIDSIVIGKWSRDTTTDVPEPGTLALLTLGGLLAATRRRKA